MDGGEFNSQRLWKKLFVVLDTLWLTVVTPFQIALLCYLKNVNICVNVSKAHEIVNSYESNKQNCQHAIFLISLTAYIQRYETPETILEEDIEDGSYLRPVIVNGKLVLNKPEKKPPGDRNKHIYENEQVITYCKEKFSFNWSTTNLFHSSFSLSNQILYFKPKISSGML